MGGKRFKADSPKPKYCSKLGVDSDVHLSLVRVQKYVTLAGFEVSIWAVIASQFLVPLQLWRLDLLPKTVLSCINGTASEHGAMKPLLYMTGKGMHLT